MKPPFLLLSFISSFAALVVLPLSPELAITPLVVTGLLLVMSVDYGRRRTPLTAPVVARKTPERLRLAA